MEVVRPEKYFVHAHHCATTDAEDGLLQMMYQAAFRKDADQMLTAFVLMGKWKGVPQTRLASAGIVAQANGGLGEHGAAALLLVTGVFKSDLEVVTEQVAKETKLKLVNAILGLVEKGDAYHQNYSINAQRDARKHA